MEKINPNISVEVNYLYSRWESNPHSRKNWILNPARLPIPPLEQTGGKNKQLFIIYLKIYPAIFLKITNY